MIVMRRWLGSERTFGGNTLVMASKDLYFLKISLLTNSLEIACASRVVFNFFSGHQPTLLNFKVFFTVQQLKQRSSRDVKLAFFPLCFVASRFFLTCFFFLKKISRRKSKESLKRKSQN